MSESLSDLLPKLQISSVISYELDKTYTTIIKPFNVGILNEEESMEIFKDGRVNSHYLERIIAKIHGLEWIGGNKPYDLYDNKNNKKIDLKGWKGRSCNFMQSSMLGTGRYFDSKKFLQHANELIYVICDTSQLPKIRYKFVDGAILSERYPKGKIPNKDREDFFK